MFALLFSVVACVATAQPSGGTVETIIGDAKQRVTFHDNGQKAVEVLLKQNEKQRWVPDGVVRTWYPNGNKRGVQRFQMGTPHGKWESYYESGQQYNAMTYQHGQLDGEARHWNETGTLTSLDQFKMVDGALHVSHVGYHTNGKKRQSGSYIRPADSRESFKEGKWEYFDEEGGLTKTEMYERGQLVQ